MKIILMFSLKLASLEKVQHSSVDTYIEGVCMMEVLILLLIDGLVSGLNKF